MEYDDALQRGLRAAVITLRARSGRRRPSPALHAGFPDGSFVSFEPPGDGLDHALRTDLVGALIARGRGESALVWLTRAGLPLWHDHDAAWTLPAVAAWAEVGEDARFVVVTPRGWYAPVTGHGRRWRRPREHS